MATAVVDYGPEEKAMQAYFREGEARVASDHLPVVAEVDVSSERASSA